MPERTLEFGKYGAQGIKGSEAVARQLDKLVDYIRTPITQRRGLNARLSYLTRSKAARAAARAAGLDATDATVRKWKSGKQNPSKANLKRIEDAYRALRRRNVEKQLTRRLNRNGRGTRVEIHPANQSQVSRPHVRAVEMRHINIRKWDRVVHAWATGNTEALHDEWTDQITELGSQWGQYEYVTNVGFAA